MTIANEARGSRWPRIRIARAVAATTLTFLGGCSSTGERPTNELPAVSPGERPPSDPTVVASQAPIARPARDAGAPEHRDGGKPFDGSSEQPNEFPWANGRPTGKIDCHGKSCVAGIEACVGDACVPLGKVKPGGYKACDDTSDCPGGLACCHAQSVSADPIVDCSARPCDGEEACIPSSSKPPGCPAGLVCKPEGLDSYPGVAGFCTEPAGGATRCGTTRCKGNQPICLAEDTSGRCVTARQAATKRSANEDAWSLACHGSQDCAAGRSCCFSPINRSSECANTCDGTSRSVLCDADADCDRYGKSSSGKPKRCVRVPDRPAWLKLCE